MKILTSFIFFKIGATRGLMASFLLSKKTIWHLNDTHMPWLILKLFKLLSLLTHGLIICIHKTKQYIVQQIKNSIQ